MASCVLFPWVTNFKIKLKDVEIQPEEEHTVTRNDKSGFVLVVFQLGTNRFEFSDTLLLWKKSQLGLQTSSESPAFGKGYKFVQCIKIIRLRYKRKALKQIRLFLRTRWKNVTKVATVQFLLHIFNGFADPLYAFFGPIKIALSNYLKPMLCVGFVFLHHQLFFVYVLRKGFFIMCVCVSYKIEQNFCFALQFFSLIRCSMTSL